MNCRLCRSSDCRLFHDDGRRTFFHCSGCGLAFVPPDNFISLDEERRRYDLHDNSEDQEGYVRFLRETITAVEKCCRRSGKILDYGSGKNAVLTGLLNDIGYDCTAFDPLYEIGAKALVKQFDAVILCEVVEHLRDLRREIRTLKSVITQKGKLVVRTKLRPSLKKFPAWWYKNDLTHINFFNDRSIRLFGALLGKPAEIKADKDIFVMQP